MNKSIRKIMFGVLTLGAMFALTSCGPSLKDSDPQQRILAVQETNDSSKLARIILFDDVQRVREAALDKLVDPGAIANELSKIQDDEEWLVIANNCDIPEARVRALMQLENPELFQAQLKYFAKNDAYIEVRTAALENINDQRFIASYGMQTTNRQLQEFAYNLLRDEEVIMQVLEGHRRITPLFKKLIQKISDETKLAKVAKAFDYRSVVERISDEDLLVDIVKHTNNAAGSAIDKISDQDRLEDIAFSSDVRDWIRVAVIKKLENEHLIYKAIDKFYEMLPNSCELVETKISNQNILQQIVLNKELLPYIRAAAIKKIKNKETLEKLILALNYEGCPAAIIGAEKVKNQRILADVLMNFYKEMHYDTFSGLLKRVTDEDIHFEILLKIGQHRLRRGESRKKDILQHCLKSVDDVKKLERIVKESEHGASIYVIRKLKRLQYEKIETPTIK